MPNLCQHFPLGWRPADNWSKQISSCVARSPSGPSDSGAQLFLPVFLRVLHIQSCAPGLSKAFLQGSRLSMEKASKALRRSGVRIRSIGSGYSDLQVKLIFLKCKYLNLCVNVNFPTVPVLVHCLYPALMLR